jgi:hypothetical protein
MGLWPTQGGEKRIGSATTLYGTVALPFVIPSVADLSRLPRRAVGRAVEGSAVPRTLLGNVFRLRSPLSSLIASTVTDSPLALNESICICYFCLSTFPLLASTYAT